MAATRNYYKTLVVSNDASTLQIKAAFRKLVMRFHPDHNPGKEVWANKKLQVIIEAYEVLSNPVRRRLYDRQLAGGESYSVHIETHRRSKSTTQYMVDIMRHQSTPGWARTAAFAYVFFDYFSKESKKAE